MADIDYSKYDDPKDIVNDNTLPHAVKVSLLEAWAEDERALIRASKEGMGGGEAPELKDVQKVLDSLNEKREANTL